MQKNNVASKTVRLGDTIEVTIQKVLSIGLQVVLPSGEQGLIRAREISWDIRSTWESWSKDFDIGCQIRALILSQEKTHLELSLRLVDVDPWEDIESRYARNRVFEGVVQGIATYGAFIQLERGVTGLLHRTELPEWAEENIEELLWVGDLVKVMVDTVDQENRRIRLTMRNQRPVRWNALEAANSLPADANRDESGVAVIHEASNIFRQSHRLSVAKRMLSVVLVEDNQEQREAVEQWIRSSGHIVIAAESAEEGLKILAQESPDVILSDLDLPGMDGITMLRMAIKKHPDTKPVLMTAWTSASKRKDELEEMQRKGLKFLVKPLLPDDLATLFSQLVHDRSEIDEGEATIVGDVDDTNYDRTTIDQKKGASKQHSDVRRLLQKAQRATGAQNVVLFRLNAAKRQIEAAAQVGTVRLNRNALTALIHSPIRDAAEDGDVVQIQDLDQSDRYGSNLRPLLSFKSCIGNPVESHSADGYAIFYFFASKAALTPNMQQFADIAAHAIGAILREQMLQQRLVDAQRTVLMGTLASGFAHEVNHHLAPLKFALESLSEKCLAVKSALDNNPTSAGSKMSEANNTLDKLGIGVDNLVKIARSFSQMSVQDQESMVRIDQIVERSIKLVLDTIGYHHIPIKLHAPEQILYTYGKPAQLQQVVVNLILNAAQQVLAARPAIGGQVHVQLDRVQKGKQPFICIKVKDDGPGIHRRLWEEIFDLGYTSRNGVGSGLGLYIARSLVEDMGGRVEVRRSYKLWGSYMLIELPVYVA